ncbi:MAG: NifB/NifX family molybdenum-iron cluster-binding protein [Candidatus Delongbacteria bacterium]|jgi:predicted Fe-Mo cluster-binding NifX family protein|nr:NifB/NifX family molybdenum-iron cluster-binding protein [Candidatus Delongbacteria bacterium]
MKIVFPSDKADWNAKLDERFGRAPGFVIYDDNDESLTFIENKEKNAGHGVGVQAAQTVIQAGADVVVTSGPFGPKASSVLTQAGIKLLPQMGEITIREALEKVNA